MNRSALLLMLSGALSGTLLSVEESRFSDALTVACPATGELRGYGRVSPQMTLLRDAEGTARLIEFRCQDPGRAMVLAGKYLADLDLSPGTVPAQVESVPVRILAGGRCVVAAVDGAWARIVAAASREQLGRVLRWRPELQRGAVANAPYPAFLDRFDRYGFGFYGMAGFGWGERVSGDLAKRGVALRAADIDPLDDLAWCRAGSWRFEPWLDPAVLDDSDGIAKNTEAEWMVRQAREQRVGISFRLYAATGGADWTARRFPDLMERPFDFLISGWHGRGDRWKSEPHLSWYSSDAQHYLAVQTMRLMRTQADQPQVMGWMHPHGELVHSQWYDSHADRSPMAQRDWRDWLARRETLGSVSRLYGRSRPFSTWEEVDVPEFATFAGLGGMIADLGGPWWARREQAGAAGEVPPQPDASWSLLNVPGDDAMQSLLKKAKAADKTSPVPATVTSFDRVVELDATALRRSGTVFLYWFPMSAAGLHVGPQAGHHRVWVNGRAAGEVGSWGALDVTALLQPGRNRISLRMLGDTWDGRIFLSSEAPSVYPYLAGDMNRLWLLWDEWRKDAKHRGWGIILDGMRQVDPERPIKFMAPVHFGDRRYLDLASRWGGFPHFTGEGMWFYPWYKRASFLYDLPATSEMSGPADDLAEMHGTVRRIFLAGLNGHDAVFAVQHYSRDPGLRRYVDEHADLLHQLGRYDIAGEQVLIHRSTRSTTGIVPPAPHPTLGERTREIQSPWNWDLGRGSLQTLGHSPLYLDDAGVVEGRMAGHRLMIDCGNEILDPGALAAIGSWVEAGGTYVAFAATGRNSLERAEAWQVQQLTGCTLEAVRTPGRGTVTIAASSGLFPGLGGRAYPDRGDCIDWNGANHCLWDVALKPAPGAEVAATYEDGRAAVVRVRRGAGQIVILGSSFWRGAADRQGIWWPDERESEVLGSLLAGLDQRPQVTCSDRMVWAQPYRSNNGLDAVACLVSWHDDRSAQVQVRMRLPRRPAAARVFIVGGERELPVAWHDGVAEVAVEIPAREVAVVRFLDAYGQDEALAHWWSYQQRIWHPIDRPSIDFTPWTQGRWIDPTVDLRSGAAWTATAPAGDAWKQPGYAANAGWSRAGSLGILTLDAGAPRSTPIFVRSAIDLPRDWQARGGTVRLVSGNWGRGEHYLGGARLYLNGTLLHDTPGLAYQDFDVTRLLRAGENVVALELLGDRGHTGIVGQLYLAHRGPAAAAIDLGGSWDGTAADGGSVTVRFPGEATVARPTVEVQVPAEWAGSRVRLVSEGDRRSVLGAWVNGRLVRRHHHMLHGHVDIDITDQLRFGQSNRIVLAGAGDESARPLGQSEAQRMRIDAIRLERFDAP